LQTEGKWTAASEILNREASGLDRANADFIVLATNTMHKLADQMMHGVSIPLLQIADTSQSEFELAKTTSSYITPP
jgi:aspartate racemase